VTGHERRLLVEEIRQHGVRGRGQKGSGALVMFEQRQYVGPRRLVRRRFPRQPASDVPRLFFKDALE
jgi:hypothetical protein